MKIRISTCKAALILSLTAMFFADESLAAPLMCQRDAVITAHAKDEPDLSHLVAALSGKETDQSARLDALERAITTTPRSQAEMMLQDRARLYLAGMAIQQQQFEAAREMLKVVSTESPLAAQAGLLIAESWRLQGNNGESLQWLLRIGRRFSDDINALQGLLRAAASLEQTDHPSEAAALYAEVTGKAMDTVRYLESLPEDRQARVAAVLSHRHHMPTALRQQLTSIMIRETPEFGQTRQIHREVSQEWQCLMLQQQQLELQSERVHQYADRLAQASQLAEESMSTLNQEIALLQTQLVSQDFSAPQIAIRKRLAEARNEKIHLQAQQDFIARTRHLLPETLADTEEKLQVMTTSFAEIRALTSDDLYKAVEQALDQVTATFRNLAGDSQRRLAEVQMQQAR
jgi:hypothetical protein